MEKQVILTLQAFALVILQLTGEMVLSSSPRVPCFFIFGDSLVDDGNNNRILTLARANYMPYGVDFPQGPSGRFTNGRTTVDLLAELLGLRELIPPYEGTRGNAILRGLNFASGAAASEGEHFPMAQQVEHFRRTVARIRRLFRGDTTRLYDYLSRCLVSVGMGSNDYLNNYFMPNIYSTSREYSPSSYADALLRDYERYLIDVYNIGARKVVLVGVGQIGCIPYELARYNGSATGSLCNEEINSAISLFNSGLVRLVDEFNSECDEAKFVYVNSFDISNDLAQNAAKYGFEEVDKGCCGVGRNNGQVTCLPMQQPCKDRSKYLFWDAFHPTEAANIIFSRKAYESTSHSDVYPMNIRQLAMA